MKNKNAITELADHFQDDSDNSCYFDFFGSREAAKEAIESLEGCHCCTNCKDCSYCSTCNSSSRLTGCYGLERVSGASNMCGKWISSVIPQYLFSQVPTVEDLNEKVLNAISVGGGDLEMTRWHTCQTTHCYAGWIVDLAGEAGYATETQVGPEFAAMMIHHKSTGGYIDPAIFYGDPDAVFDFLRDQVTEKGDKK